MDPAVVEDWHQLPKDIGLSDGPINIRHHDFGFIVPKEDMALHCLASLIQSEFGSIGPFHETELLNLLAARCLAILQDKVLNLLFSIKGLSFNCLLISQGPAPIICFNYILPLIRGEVVAEPRLLPLHQLRHFIIAHLLPKGEFARDDSQANIPGVDGVIYLDDKVLVGQVCQRVFDELLVRDLVGVECLKDLFRVRVFVFTQLVATHWQ